METISEKKNLFKHSKTDIVAGREARGEIRKQIEWAEKWVRIEIDQSFGAAFEESAANTFFEVNPLRSNVRLVKSGGSSH